MKTNEVVFIIDKSGSMSNLVSDIIGGFNSMLNEQKENNEDGKVLVSTILFNENRKVVHDREDIANVKEMIKEKQDKDNWEFMFIGANIDAVETAKDMGINEDYAVNYISDGFGQGLVYGSVSEKILASRRAKRFCKSSNACFAKVTEDYNRRRGSK